MFKIATLTYLALGYASADNHDCSTALSLAPNTLPFTHLDFDGSKAFTEIGNGWKSFFVNSDVEKCPIVSCRIKSGPNCANDHTDANLKIGEAPNEDWKIFAQTDN